MKSLSKLMVVIAALGAMSPVSADRGPDAAPAASGRAELRVNTDFSGGYSFADIADLSMGNGLRRLKADLNARLPETPAAAKISTQAPARIAVAAPVPSTASHSIISNAAADDSAVVTESGHSTVAASNAAASSRSKPAAATSDAPVPTGWMMLICGLAVMAFMARRRGDPDQD